MSELKYWVWMSDLPDVRPVSRIKLIEHFGGPREVYYALTKEYKAVSMLRPGEIKALEDKDLSRARSIMQRCAEENIGIVTLTDAAYPRRLAAINDPPVCLYVRGRLPFIDDEAAFAIVGTRSATPYGLKMSRRMGFELTKCGGLVISGLTRGNDEMAALGALQAGGRCVGVMPCPIDDTSWGGDIVEDVATCGALISEYPPGAKKFRMAYRYRNRVASGLATAVVVIEAPEGSGALLFADEAASQGREIYVVPANADSDTSKGSNKLLREGAQPATCGWDVAEDFEAQFRYRLHEPGEINMPPETRRYERGKGFAVVREPIKKKKKAIDKPQSVEYIDLGQQLAGLSDKQLKIVGAIETPGTHVDDIIARTGFPASEVLSELTMLQIEGFVRQEAGKRFSLEVKRN